ncbi:MAG: phosphoribosylglycinamide formyltransferase [Calditrichia bacterium]
MTNTAILASGRGSNFMNIHQQIKSGKLNAAISCLITDNPMAGALKYAQENDIPTYIVRPNTFGSPRKFGEALLHILEENQVEWIILAGYLKKIPENLTAKYSNRIVNIHPALLPAFGGKGMYGRHVHQAVLNSGAQVSGVTVHLVNNDYDRGPVVMQQAVDISECHSAEAIAEKVLEIEHRIYSKALQRLLDRKFEIKNNRVIFL